MALTEARIDVTARARSRKMMAMQIDRNLARTRESFFVLTIRIVLETTWSGAFRQPERLKDPANPKDARLLFRLASALPRRRSRKR